MPTYPSKRVIKHERGLSELEGVVLGLLTILGPCTPYVIRTALRRSPISTWSGSAGAIYPLMRRLEKRNLCTSIAFKTGKRSGRKYEPTGKGSEALRIWLGPPLMNEATMLPPDPIRTRLSFITSLSINEQKDLLSDAQVIIESHIAHSEKECLQNEKNGRTLDYCISLGAFLTSRARLEWIKEVEKLLTDRE